jgi:hypothetical protein
MTRRAMAAALGGAVLAVAGCSSTAAPAGAPLLAPPSWSPTPQPVVAAPPSIGSSTAGSMATSSPSSTPSFAAATAVDCAGHPTAAQVLATLRSRGVLSTNINATARIGPLCADTWQYTVLVITGREPLQVITQGAPGSLILITAGTDVCSTQVQTQAPIGIVTAAQC